MVWWSRARKGDKWKISSDTSAGRCEGSGVFGVTFKFCRDGGQASIVIVKENNAKCPDRLPCLLITYAKLRICYTFQLTTLPSLPSSHSPFKLNAQSKKNSQKTQECQLSPMRKEILFQDQCPSTHESADGALSCSHMVSGPLEYFQ